MALPQRRPLASQQRLEPSSLQLPSRLGNISEYNYLHSAEQGKVTDSRPVNSA